MAEKRGTEYRPTSGCPLLVRTGDDQKDWVILIPRTMRPYFLKVSPELAKKLIEEAEMEPEELMY